MLLVVLAGCGRREELQAHPGRRDESKPATAAQQQRRSTLRGAPVTGHTADTKAPKRPAAFTTPTMTINGKVLYVDATPARAATVSVVRRLAVTRGLERVCATSTAGQDGSFELSLPVEPDLDLKAELPDFQSRARVLTGSGNVQSWVARGEKFDMQVTLVVERTSAIEGIVLAPDGSPVEGAAITAFALERYSSTRCDTSPSTSTATGNFRLAGLLPGDLAIVAEKPGYARAVKKAYAPATGLVLQLKRGALVAGRLVVTDTSQPLPRCKLRLSPEGLFGSSANDYTTRTGALGEFVFEDVAPGTYLPRVWEDETLSIDELAQKITVREGEALEGVVFRCNRAKTLAGRVLDAGTSLPLAGVKYVDTYNHHDGQEKAETTATGEFRITGIPASENGFFRPELEGYYLLDLQGVPTDRLSVPMDRDKQETRIEVAMARAPAITGRVISEFGGPLAGAEVKLYRWNLDLEGVAYSTDRDGRFSIPAQPDAKVRLRISAVDHATSYTELLKVEPAGQMLPDVMLYGGGALEGRVIDQARQPVAGAELKAEAAFSPSDLMNVFSNPTWSMGIPFPDKLAAVTSGRDGSFRIPHLPEGSIVLKVSQSGYAHPKLSVHKLARNEVKRGLEVRLAKTAQVTGKSIDSASGEPVPGAEITSAAHPDTQLEHSANVLSDAGGCFLLTVPLETSCVVSAKRNGYEPAVEEGVVAPDTQLEIRMKPVPGFSVVGEVIDGKDRSPITEYDVKIEDRSGRLNLMPEVRKEGSGFSVELPPDASVQITVQSPGRASAREMVSWSGKQRETPVTFVLMPGVKVTGRVVNAGDRSAVAGARIEASPVGKSTVPETRTNADGRFVLEVVPPGMVTVGVSTEGAEPLTAWKVLSVPDGRDFDAGDILLGETATIRGRVVRGKGDTGVPGIKLTLNGNWGKNKSSVTGSDGSFEFVDVPVITREGEPQIHVPSHDQYVTTGKLRAGEVTKLVIRLGAATLTGQVQRAGEGVNAALTVQEAGGGGRYIRTDYEGRYKIEGLAPGRTGIVVYDESGKGFAVRETLEIPESGVVERNFVLPSAKLAGVVLDADEKPVKGVNVRLLRRMDDASHGSDEQVVDTKTDGAFEFQGITAGRYQLIASGKVGFATEEVTVAGDDGVAGIELRLPRNPATLISYTYDYETGQPITDVWAGVCTLQGVRVAEFENSRGPDGDAKLENLPAGTYEVRVGGTYLTVAVHHVTLEPGETRVLRDVLSWGGWVNCRVRAADGFGLGGAKVSLRPADPQSITEPFTGTTTWTGEWQFQGVPAGTYTAEAQWGGGNPVTSTVEVSPLSDSFIVLTIP